MSAEEAGREGLRALPHCMMRALLLLLMFAAGVSFLSPEASGQTPNRARFTWSTIGEGIRFTPTVLRGVTGAYTVNVSGIDSLDRVRVCTKTATPTTNAAAYWKTNCTYIAASNGNKTVTVTQTMVTNGGFVMVAHVHSPSDERVRRAEWIPLEPPDIVLSATSLTVTEGTSPTATYTVALNFQPTGGVEVLVSRGNAGYVLNKAGGTQAASQTLTFTTSTWNTGQAITVIALDDANTAGGTSNITHTTVDANTVAEYDAASENLQVTLIDDEATIAVSRGTGALALTEGGNATYTVTLAGQPTGAVVVDVTSNDAGAAAVAPAVLTFSATTWNTGRAVTVSAVSDADSDDETVTVTHAVNDGASADEFDPAPDVTFTVTVTDNTPYRGEFDSGHGGSTISIAPAELFAVVGTQLLTISSTQATFFNPYTVHLCPFTSVPRSTGASVSGCTTIANRAATNRIDWNVSVTQAMVTNGGFVVMVKQAVGSFQLVIYANWVPLVTPRTPTLALAPASITENGGVSTLSSAPTAAVTLTVGAAAVSPAVAGDFTLSAAPTLIFATGATTSTGVVTLTAVNNAVDAADKRVTVTGTVASTDRRVINPTAMTLTITDDDTAGVEVDTDPSTPAVADTTALAVTEDGTTTTGTYTVVLATEPTGPVTIAVTSGDAAVAIDTDATPQTRALTFSTANWATAQTVTVSGQEDVDGDNEAVSLAHAATSGDPGYAGVTIAAVTVNVADNDAPGFLVSPTGLALTEGESGSYTLRLNSQPSGPVTVAVVAPTNTDVTRAPSSLTFAAGAWNTAQTVTVSVANDTDGLNETATVSHTATSSDSNYTIAAARAAENVTVTVTDANPPGLTVNPTTLALTEQDATAGSGTYTVALAALPGGLVTVSVTSGHAAVTIDSDATPLTRTLTYSATTWNTAQTVTATAVDDNNPTGETVTVTHAVSGTADATSYPTTLSLTAANVTVTVTDNDVPGLAVSATDLTTNGVPEGGTATYTVRLNTQPTGPVTVSVSSNNADVPADVDGDASNGAQTTLTFTTASWETAQAVTVRAGEDADAANDAVTWTHDPSGADYETVANAELAFTVNDDETAGIEVDTAPGTMGVQTGTLVVTEEDAAAGQAAYTVRLTAQPAGAVTVRAGSGDPSAVTTAPAALVFSATTWNTAQTVMARAVNDADQVGETVTVTHAVSGTADATSYPTTLAAVTVTVQVRDNDRQVWKSTAFNFDVSTTVLFSTATAQSVVVQVPSDHPVQSWSTRRILACAWTAVRPVPVGGGLPAECMVINDRPNVTGTLSSPITPTQAMLDNGGVVIGMTVTSSEHNHVFFYTEWVPLVAPRTPTLVLSPAAVTENGGVATVTARLSSAPTAAVTLTVAATAVAPAVAGDVTLSPGPTLTFAAGTATSTGTVTLTAVNNAVDAADKRVTVTGTVASSDDRVIAPAAVTLTITDDDTAGVTTPTDVSLAEGSETAYSVVLATEPAAAVTVTVASGSTAVTVDTGATPAPRTLLFTPMTWNTARAVTVRAAADTDHRHETATLTHAFSSGDDDYAGLRPSTLTVEVTDTTDLPVVTVVGGTTTGEVNGHPWLIRRGSGVPAGVRVTLPERTLRTLRGDLTVTIQRVSAPAAVTTAAPDAGQARRFSLGPEAARLMVDVTVTTNPEGGLPAVLDGELAVCLPVSPEVGQAAGSSPVHLLHDADGDGVWTVLAEWSPDEPEVCADVRRLSPFAVGYEDSGTFAEGVPEEISRETSFTPVEGEVERYYRLLSEDEKMAAKDQAERNGFRLGTPTGPGTSTVHVALAVTVTPSVPGRLCLGVTKELVRDAHGRPLVLLHAGEPVDGSEPEPDAAGHPPVRVCADVEAFSPSSPFAVGYRGVEFSQEKQTFVFRTGQADEKTLPAARGGSGKYSYMVLEAETLPAGLSYDNSEAGAKHGGTITGTATATMPERTYMLRATDESYNKETATLAFTIEVKPGIESRDLALVLAGIGRTLATDAVEILGSRAVPPPARLHVTLGGQVLRLTDPAGSAPAASPSASGTPSPLVSGPSPLAGEGRGEGAAAAAPAATPGPSPWQRVTGVAVGVARALGVTLDAPALPSAPPGAGQSDGSTFPNAQPLLARSAFELPLTQTDTDGLPTWTVWGRGAASGFAGQPEEGFKMDGTLYSGYLGLDYRQASLLMGLAVAHSTGTVDYERTGGTTAGVDVQLTSLLPYAHWQPRPGLGLWGLLGAGWGEMDLKAVGDPATYTTALTSWLGAVGGRQALTTWQGIDLAAKTDAFLTTLRSEAKTNLPGARGHAERVRLLLEGQTAVALSPVSRVQPRLEVGGRWDSGTAEQGLGLELGGGLAYTQTEWGLSVDMQGRYLLVHEDRAFEDWGASVNVRLDPGLGGEGAYLTVAPVWGQPGSGVEQLWGQAAAVPGDPPAARAAGWRPGNVEIDVGYGLALADGRGLLTPYGGLVLGDPGTARYRLGSRWALSTLLDLSVEGERAEQPGQAAAHGVSVRLGWQW